jgi:hypothetical protein
MKITTLIIFGHVTFHNPLSFISLRLETQLSFVILTSWAKRANLFEKISLALNLSNKASPASGTVTQ